MFLPTTAKEVKALGWDYIDVILFTADAYIDHPAFGAAVVGRLLEAEGYRVAIVPQPNWRDDLRDFTKLGAPRLFFGVSGGAMDSMVNHYTANLRLRSNDAYTSGGKAGFRPDRAVTVYTQILKRLFPHVPVVVGGIEASLRRLTHYDYWSDSIKPSVLAECGADLLIYGMGEGSCRRWRVPCGTDSTPSCCARFGRLPSWPTAPMSSGSIRPRPSGCTATRSACAARRPSARTSSPSNGRAISNIPKIRSSKGSATASWSLRRPGRCLPPRSWTTPSTSPMNGPLIRATAAREIFPPGEMIKLLRQQAAASSVVTSTPNGAFASVIAGDGGISQGRPSRFG